VLQQFGHALGLIKEHQNPKANIPWNKKMVYKDMTAAPNFWSKQMVDANIFTKYPSENLPGGYRDFDPHSIMAYYFPEAWTGVSQWAEPRPCRKATRTDRKAVSTRPLKVERDVKATLARMVSLAGLATMKVCPLCEKNWRLPSGRSRAAGTTSMFIQIGVTCPVSAYQSMAEVRLIGPLTRFRERLRS